MTTNGNGTQATIDLDAKTLLEQAPQETATQRKAREKAEREAKKKVEQDAKRTAILTNQPIAVSEIEEELGSVDCSIIDQSMLIVFGREVQNPDGIQGISVVGRVVLQVYDTRIEFGRMTEKTLQIAQEAMTFCYEAEMSSADILAIADDAKRAWCLGFKVQELADRLAAEELKRKQKEQKEADRKKDKVAKSKAILAKIKGASK